MKGDVSMTSTQKAPVTDWATDFDHTYDDYAAAPEIWDELRERCPVAHSEAHGGVWMPTRHEDVSPSPTTPSTSAPKA